MEQEEESGSSTPIRTYTKAELAMMYNSINALTMPCTPSQNGFVVIRNW